MAEQTIKVCFAGLFNVHGSISVDHRVVIGKREGLFDIECMFLEADEDHTFQMTHTKNMYDNSPECPMRRMSVFVIEKDGNLDGDYSVAFSITGKGDAYKDIPTNYSKPAAGQYMATGSHRFMDNSDLAEWLEMARLNLVVKFKPPAIVYKY